MIQQKWNESHEFEELRLVGCDLNTRALEATQIMLEDNKMEAQLIESNLFSSLGDLKADIVFFNPPYVETEDDELEKAQQAKGIEATWAGGKDGVVVLRQFLTQLPDYIKKTSLVYILLIS